MKSRNYAIIDEQVLLEYTFFQNGIPKNISSWTKIEIYDADPREDESATIVQTILPASITNVSAGKYQALMSAVSIAGNYYDKQTYSDWDGLETVEYGIIPVRLVVDEGKVRKLQGLSYNNPDLEYNGGWGNVITPDELRWKYHFGNPLVSPDGQTIQDDVLQQCCDEAVGIVERDLNITLVKRRYKAYGVNGAERDDVEGTAGIDFEYDEPYDFDREMFNNKFIYFKLRKRPIAEVHKVMFRDPLNNNVADITTWCKPNFKTGSLEFFPTFSSLNMLFLQSSWFVMGNFIAKSERYPDAFYVDYDAGLTNVLHMKKVYPELFTIVGMVAFLIAASFVGDGRLSAIGSSSISMEGISESYSTTLSATSAMFGARILQYVNFIKEFYKRNKNKYGSLLIGAL